MNRVYNKKEEKRTTEHLLAEEERREKIDKLLHKMTLVLERFENTLITHENRIKQLEETYRINCL